MSDHVVVGTMLVAFAGFVTAHAMIAVGLFARVKWQAVVAALVIPSAPYFAWRAKMRVRAVAWGVFALAYFVARSHAQ